MKRFTLTVSTVVFSLFLLLVSPVRAQAPAASLAPSQPGKVVMIYLYALNNSYNPSFDTGGELVDGLSSKDLSIKYFRTSMVAIINFMVEKGYRVISCVAKPAPIANNFGGGLEGYMVLMEKVR